MDSAVTELNIVTIAAGMLQSFGRASVKYITAEFAPFSDQFRPDLIFWPDAMPGHVFFVEYRLASSHMFQKPADALARQLAEHRDFVEMEQSVNLHFAFASSGDRDSDLAASLAAHRITYLAPMPTPDLLATAVRDRVGSTSAGAGD